MVLNWLPCNKYFLFNKANHETPIYTRLNSWTRPPSLHIDRGWRGRIPFGSKPNDVKRVDQAGTTSLLGTILVSPKWDFWWDFLFWRYFMWNGDWIKKEEGEDEGVVWISYWHKYGPWKKLVETKLILKLKQMLESMGYCVVHILSICPGKIHYIISLKPSQDVYESRSNMQARNILNLMIL